MKQAMLTLGRPAGVSLLDIMMAVTQNLPNHAGILMPMYLW